MFITSALSTLLGPLCVYAQSDEDVSSEAKKLVASPENLEKTDDKLKRMEAEVLSKLDRDGSKKDVSVAVKSIPVAGTPTPTAPLKDLKILENHPAIQSLDESPNTIVPINNPTAEKLSIAESQVKILSRELSTTKKTLRSAEKRIDELSAVVRTEYTKSSAPKTAGGSLSAHDNEDPKVEDIFSRERARLEPSAAQEEPPVLPLSSEPIQAPAQYSDEATVTTPQTPVRVGPSRSDSTLYYLPVHYKVTIERRTGEWYRIIANNGVRGWVYGGSLTFFPNANQDSTVQIKAYNTKYEPIHPRF